MTTRQLPAELREAIVASGYFPEFVQATILQAVGGEEVADSLVHHEATFHGNELRRHVTVLVLTPTRFIVGHTDDGDAPQQTQALTTVETVPLRHLRSVALTQVATDPEKFGRGRGSDLLAETWLVVNWGSVRRLEIEPARCLACRYAFEDRTRLSKPGRCPVCRATRIALPRFRVVPR